VTLWDFTVTLLLVAIELAVLTVIAAPHWVARQLRKALDRLLAPFARSLSPRDAERRAVQTSREAR
jgi:hypothetical protein